MRGNGDIIVEERRPVPLFQHVMVGRRMFDLFAGRSMQRSEDDAEVNPELTRVARDDW